MHREIVKYCLLIENIIALVGCTSRLYKETILNFSMQIIKLMDSCASKSSATELYLNHCLCLCTCPHITYVSLAVPLMFRDSSFLSHLTVGIPALLLLLCLALHKFQEPSLGSPVCTANLATGPFSHLLLCVGLLLLLFFLEWWEKQVKEERGVGADITTLRYW